MLEKGETEWVVYGGDKDSPNVAHKVYCESWDDWAAYRKHQTKYRDNNPLIARGLTEAQARAMVRLTNEEK